MSNTGSSSVQPVREVYGLTDSGRIKTIRLTEKNGVLYQDEGVVRANKLHRRKVAEVSSDIDEYISRLTRQYGYSEILPDVSPPLQSRLFLLKEETFSCSDDVLNFADHDYFLRPVRSGQYSDVLVVKEDGEVKVYSAGVRCQFPPKILMELEANLPPTFPALHCKLQQVYGNSRHSFVGSEPRLVFPEDVIVKIHIFDIAIRNLSFDAIIMNNAPTFMRMRYLESMEIKESATVLKIPASPCSSLPVFHRDLLSFLDNATQMFWIQRVDTPYSPDEESNALTCVVKRSDILTIESWL